MSFFLSFFLSLYEEDVCVYVVAFGGKGKERKGKEKGQIVVYSQRYHLTYHDVYQGANRVRVHVRGAISGIAKRR